MMTILSAGSPLCFHWLTAPGDTLHRLATAPVPPKHLMISVVFMLGILTEQLNKLNKYFNCEFFTCVLCLVSLILVLLAYPSGQR